MPCHNKVCEFKSALKHFQVLVAHFQHVAEARESTAEVCGRARFISNKLCDYRVLRFIMFMQDVLKIIATLSLTFQKTGSTCLDVLDALDTACLQLTELSMAPGPTYLEFLDDIQHDDDIHTYRGVELTHYVERDYNDMGVMCTTLLDSVCARLDRHTDTSMAMLKAARVFDTREWPLERADLPGFGNVQIQALPEISIPCLRGWTLMKHISSASGLRSRLILDSACFSAHVQTHFHQWAASSSQPEIASLPSWNWQKLSYACQSRVPFVREALVA